jgi:hypothetical protein
VPAVVPAVRVQEAAVGLKVPVLLVVKLTVPVGVVGLDEVSVTVAVQLVATPDVTELGEQATLVVVLCRVDVRTNVPWLEVWVVSPP